ncbi:MAG: hypothetical protein ACRED9_05740 [Caulobacteraceae bacterium]
MAAPVVPSMASGAILSVADAAHRAERREAGDDQNRTFHRTAFIPPRLNAD